MSVRAVVGLEGSAVVVGLGGYPDYELVGRLEAVDVDDDAITVDGVIIPWHAVTYVREA